MNSIFLKDLFKMLEEDNVDYLVLRGYQNLPEKYSHDIDFSVINENELTTFFNVLHNLSNKYNYSITRDVVRVGLLKVFLHFGNEILKIDVFCSFSYGGLEYINIDDLHNSKRKSPTNISIPSLNYELAISLLKEILHNSRIRKDKVSLLRSQYEKKTFDQPFKNYFSNKNIKNLSYSLFLEEKLMFKNLSLSFKLSLILNNIKIFGIIANSSRIFYFFWVKYFFQKKYDVVILKKRK
ncbi:hypothetical protein OAC46_00555 [Flavobacteriaceae bacterium]|nr:hypothetical protein [Flavobacteriaceae bacterium]